MNTTEGQDDRSKGAGKTDVGSARRSIALDDNRIDSRDLFAETREIIIAHGADLYRLRLTGQNKLILTK